jgi:hypothetical protein
MKKMVTLSGSREISFIVLFVFLFFATNFSPPLLGVIYALMLIVYGLVLENTMPELPISKGKLDLKNLLILTAIGLGLWLFLTNIVFNKFGVATDITKPESIIGLLASSTSPPVITENPYIYLFVFGLIIPIAETFFFLGVLLPYINQKLKRQQVKVIRWLMAAIVSGSVVSLWHYTAHVFSDMALIADFIFFFISSLIALEQDDLKIALVLHILANSLIIAKSIGWF